MSNIDDKILEITPANQEFFIELEEKDGEIVSGGIRERFTIENHTTVRIPYRIDGQLTTRPYGGSVWTVDGGGIIEFDYDFGRKGYQSRKYNLSDGSKYAFQYDRRTPYPNDIDLYKIS